MRGEERREREGTYVGFIVCVVHAYEGLEESDNDYY
jgi:hypothetical protein